MRFLLTGASGQLGPYILRELAGGGHAVAAWSRGATGRALGVDLEPVELADAAAARRAFDRALPDVVIHAAAVSKPAEAFHDPARAQEINVEATRRLLDWTARLGAQFVILSTDMVFDGEKGHYSETDEARPRTVYGRTKHEAERFVSQVNGAIVLRLSLLYGPSLTSRPTFFDEQSAAMRGGKPVRLFHDEFRTPLDYPSAASAILTAARSGIGGVHHLGGPERLSRVEFGQRLAAALHADPACIVPCGRSSMASAEPRPRDLSLDSSLFDARVGSTARLEAGDTAARIARLLPCG